MKLNLFLPSREQLKGRSRRGVATFLRPVLRLLGRGWARSPVRRLVQLLVLAAFLVLLLVILVPSGEYDDPGGRIKVARMTQDKTFLQLDPLAGVGAALGARAWTWSLVGAAIVLGACVIVPRVFCGWVCPLGTLIDIVGWLTGGRGKSRSAGGRRRWWVHLRYYLLAAVLAAALLGVAAVGLVAAIPLLTRGVVSVAELCRFGAAGESEIVPPVTAEQWAGAALLVAVLLTTLFGRRFWCRCLCPTGALLSLASRLRLTDRKVTPDCVRCGKCVGVCSFDAIAADFSTRSDACTFCQDCGGACPTGAITFGGRWDRTETLPHDESPPDEVNVSRRGFLVGAAVGAVTVLGLPPWLDPPSSAPYGHWPVRPPGSVPEDEFLGRCVRCGNCIEVCPSKVLRPAGGGFDVMSLWTPHAAADWGGCQSDCNRCGHACPTGAIRPLPIEEKRAAHMGRAVVDTSTCLPHAGLRDCGMCETACSDAGYAAIVLIETGGLWAPQVDAERCVGCGQCQAMCYRTNHLELGDLKRSAIRVHAGGDREDRLSNGSYLALRKSAAEASNPAPAKKVDVPYEFDLPELPDE